MIRAAVSVASDHRPAASPASKWLGALLSAECLFVLFVFAGRYKAMPVFADIGVDLTALFFGLSVIAAGIRLWRNPRLLDVPLRWPLTFFLLFQVHVVVSYFWSSGEEVNQDKLFNFLTLVSWPFFFTLLVVSQDHESQSRFIICIIVLSILILLYYSYYRFVVGLEWFSDEKNLINVTSYHSYGSHAHYLLVFILAIILSARTPGPRIIGTLLTIPPAVVLIYIGSRGEMVLSILAIPIGILLLLPFWGGLHRAWTIVLWLVIGLVCAAVFMASLGNLLPLESTEGMYSMRRLQWILEGRADDSVTARIDAQLFALAMWFERPVFGNGFGEFAVRHELVYPHNLPLEIMAELGLVGLTLFLSLCATTLRQMVQSARMNQPNWINLSIMLLFAIDLLNHTTVQGYLGEDRVFFTFLGAAAGLAATRTEKNGQ